MAPFELGPKLDDLSERKVKPPLQSRRQRATCAQDALRAALVCRTSQRLV